MNKVDEKALEHQNIPMEYINDIRKYCKKRFKNTDSFTVATSCFNYGVILGKRQERERYKKELEKAIMENIRLKSFIYKIKEITEETMKIL
ncbi:MAG: hypothetical protein LKE46_14550 [Clostridium sp.]|jgi:hypothetical protein|uniref:hypothetical protein n=1 Tax=Clostridium sp. TaxID=1506 RepID=UPI0025BBCCB4|nr:hypothetical protein [Clostridium sp.]MCH3965461.1 hypothetical protein [Clostridium sp.]MCI2202811.1 hypothetical protein [Clostridium sp.]